MKIAHVLVVIFTGALFASFSSPPEALAQSGSSSQPKSTTQRLFEEISDVREDTEIISETVEYLEESLANSIKISGYVDVEYIMDDTEGQADGFRIHHFSLFFEKKFPDEWSVFSEIEFEDAPYFEADTSGEFTHSEGKIFLEQVYADYSPSVGLNFRAGRFLTPAGIWNINHYPPFVTTQGRPQHIRMIFPQYLDGLGVHGAVNIAEVTLGYMLYLANGEGNPGHGDDDNSKALGGRFEFKVNFGGELAFGVSTFSDKRHEGLEKTAFGTDAMFRLGFFKVQFEYAQAELSQFEGGSYGSTGYYVEPQINILKFTFFGRYDFYNANDSVPNNDIVVYTGGVNYHWSPVVVSKIEVNMYDTNREENGEDHMVLILSTALFF